VTNKESAVLMARLVAAFPNAKTTPETMALYLEYLAPLPYQRMERAVADLVMTHPYPSLPTIADLLRAGDVDTSKLAQAIREKKPLSRDYVFGWVVGEPLNPIPAKPAAPALPEPATVDVRAELATLKALMTGRAG
jgi:hypothetical protein